MNRKRFRVRGSRGGLHRRALSNKTTTKAPETTTTVTTSYDPRNDIIISLYGIKPSIDKIHEIYNDAVDDMIKAAEIAETETPEVE